LSWYRGGDAWLGGGLGNRLGRRLVVVVVTARGLRIGIRISVIGGRSRSYCLLACDRSWSGNLLRYRRLLLLTALAARISHFGRSGGRLGRGRLAASRSDVGLGSRFGRGLIILTARFGVRVCLGRGSFGGRRGSLTSL